MFVDTMPGAEAEVIHGRDHVMSPGGKGVNQALAASYAESDVAFVGMVGDDDNGKRARKSLRRAGVKVSGVGVSDDQATGIALIINGNNGLKRIFVCNGANEHISSDQVPQEILNSKAYVLAHMDVRPEEARTVLNSARAGGARTIVNPVRIADLSANMYENIDYLILDNNQARELCRQPGQADHERDIACMAYAIAETTGAICIVICDDEGSVAIYPDGTGWYVGMSGLPSAQNVHIAGSNDAYAGTLAACLKNGMRLDKAMRYASAARSLTRSYFGTRDAFPLWGDIEQACLTTTAPEIVSFE